MGRKYDERRVFPRKVIGDKIKEQGDVCARCGAPLSLANAQGHHCIAYSRGGPTHPVNLEALHKKCHDETGAEERGNEYGTKGNFGYDDEKRGNDLVNGFYKKKTRPS